MTSQSINQLITIHKRLLSATETTRHRYLFDAFNINNRLTGLIGARGTGKTTLLLQFIKERLSKQQDAVIYVSLDHLYFSDHSLLDFVNELYEVQGCRYFFFDEVHKHPNWNQILKNIHDSYPDVYVVFSGSSSIDLIQGTHDLSRRGVLFRLGGMSFREYLSFQGVAEIEPVGLEQLLSDRSALENQVAEIPKLRGYFKDYLQSGYYPFFLEGADTYQEKLLRVIDKTIYEDIANHYRLNTDKLPYFKRLLSYMATIQPGELSRNNISKHVGLDNKTVQHYLHILQETGLAELIRDNRAGSQLLKANEKIYLDNPNLYQTISHEIGQPSQVGTVRELFFIKMLKHAGHQVYYSKVGDFEVDGVIFEVGGKGKTTKQIRDIEGAAYLVKDDILYGGKQEIPLHLFGFLY